MSIERIKFVAGDIVSMLIEGDNNIGVVEAVGGDSLFVRWEFSGNKKVRSWGWISSEWVPRDYFSMIRADEISIKRNRGVYHANSNN